jgi:hypothetical protein
MLKIHPTNTKEPLTTTTRLAAFEKTLSDDRRRGSD